MSAYRALHDGWTLTAADADVPISGVPGDGVPNSDELGAGGPTSGLPGTGVPISGVPAAVPGCVHTDLLAAGLIEDPYLDDNEIRLSWIGRTEWVYETSFAWAPDEHERTDLVCAGLDTVATVVLNGVEVGRTANQHRSYRFPVRHLLREGDNTLSVRFASAYAYAEAQRAALGDRPGAYDEPYQFIRKMACNFGWDWGPTVVTAGIWRPIGLSSWSGARLAEVRPLVTTDGRTGHVEVRVRAERTTEEPHEITAEVAGIQARSLLAPGAREAVLRLEVPDPELWWPRGHGGQTMYDLTVSMGEERWHRRIGFRSVELDRDAFAISVNGRPVFVRGVNWIPDDCFPARVTRDRLAARLGQAVEMNVNLLRVWGGGLYESEDFYDLADSLGLLVWQDFPFACAAYPEEEPFRSEVAAEARENVSRLAPHPSLVLWCGNNENLEGHADWGWRDRLGGRSWGAGFYHDLLPSIVAELDPTRPYWPGSPYSGAPDLPPNDPAHGTIHIWDVWNREDYTRYAEYRPRFAAEFGFQGPPAYATLRRAVSGELSADAPLVLHHQKAIDGNAKLLRGLADHLPRPRAFADGHHLTNPEDADGGTHGPRPDSVDNGRYVPRPEGVEEWHYLTRPERFDDWHYLTQVNQARAVAFGIGWFRTLAPYCSGTIMWQLNDCWPVTSWSAIDGDARRKPLWYALRRVYADRILEIRDGAVVAVNDSDEPWRGDLSVIRYALGGEPLAKETFQVAAEPRSVARVELPRPLATPGDPAAEVLAARLDDRRTLAFFAEDAAVAFPAADFDARAEPAPGGYRVTVTARTIVRELALFPDRLDPAAEVDDMLLTLLPGETATFHVTTTRALDPAALTTPPVLRCLNEPAAG
ncbi:glycoside hydrolase family 2 TIM barrel-domain containing protein [Sphaerisporangium sp. NPDC005289]|uniref:glycoside hydrolase family 2 protein n=1 Tax=Sphaerisporangium sp. NPDC005289 TaxID=3155247 RepID=UPI0033AE8DAB